MPPRAVASTGTLLKIGDGATPTEAFTTIAEVKDISGPQFTMDTEETTSHDSAGWKEYIPTLKDGGEVTFDVNYFGDDTQRSLWDDYENRTFRNFQMIFPTDPAETCAFGGYITSFGMNSPVAGVLTSAITIQVVGAPVWS